jgi:hypothetical protein
VKNIIAPGFSVVNDVYPKIFSLYDDINRLKNFYPIGCSFQHPSPSLNTYSEVPYNNASIDFLKKVVDISGPLPCRDALIVKMLSERFGIDAYYSGDLAIYDEEFLNKTYSPPKSINSIVVTLQHHLKYIEQSIELMKKLKHRFPQAKLYVAHHGKPKAISATIAARANELGYQTLNIYGGAANIEKYKDIDLHVGYRLHGHIAFLRYRKPSFLMVEDARAFGFSQTQGTQIGCIQALDPITEAPNDDAPNHMLQLINESIDSNFTAFQQTFDFVDHTYNSQISPYFDKLAEQTLNF